jgi:type IV pilus assembly protein PilC
MAAATFLYKAVDGSGIPMKGEIVGSDESSVKGELKARGLTVMDLKEKKGALQADIKLFQR